MKSLSLVISVVCIFSMFAYVTSIKCYICNSYYAQDCADYFDNSTQTLQNCDHGTMCRKIVQSTYFDGVWETRYIRQCAELGEVGAYEGRSCEERTGTYRVRMRYCHCDNQNGCNTASTLPTSLAVCIPCIYMFTKWLLTHL